jgi:aerobic-type carbon monoxide dehydrogenase small subunit (CoxS/CutS family)
MEQTFTLIVNGKSRTVTTHPERPLLEVLREELGLRGTKYGCGEGECGACTVLVAGQKTHSCITPVSTVDRQAILTIEGLAHGDRLHPVQEAFLEEGGYQCGYCTPGMIMAVVSLLKERPQPTEAEVLSSLESQVCRCCAYPKILNSVRKAAELSGRTQS